MKKNTARRIVTLSLIGASAFALSACTDEEVNARSYRDAQSCVEGGGSPDVCEAEFAAAQQLHQESAPRYEDRALCEQEHGEGNCGESASQSGGHSSFMPVLMGYMIGRSMDSGRSMAATPLYPTAAGGYASANSRLRTPSIGTQSTLRSSAFQTPASTVRAAPMTRANVSTRGGFGSTRAVSFGG